MRINSNLLIAKRTIKHKFKSPTYNNLQEILGRYFIFYGKLNKSLILPFFVVKSHNSCLRRKEIDDRMSFTDKLLSNKDLKRSLVLTRWWMTN